MIVHEAFKIIGDIRRFDALGGRDSLFGVKHIYEGVLKEKHIEKGLDKGEGGFRYKGMEQYGNIVSDVAVKGACETCKEAYNFTDKEFRELIAWYGGRKSVDAIALGLIMDLWLKGEL